MSTTEETDYDSDDLVGAMYTDGNSMIEVVARDGTVGKEPCWALASALDDPNLAADQRECHRYTQHELETHFTRLGFVPVHCEPCIYPTCGEKMRYCGLCDGCPVAKQKAA